MINKKVDDAIFEVILTHAFREAFAQEMEQIEAEDDQAAKPSEKYRKQEQRYYKKMQRKPIKAMSIVRTTAACVAAIICLSSGAMMFSPPVRAAVVDTVVGIFGKYVTVDMSDKDNVLAIGKYTMGYVPKEFLLVETYQMDRLDCYYFSNGSEFFKVYFYQDNESLLKYDNEEIELIQTKVNDRDAHYLKCEDGSHILFWNQGNETISIEGNIGINVMLKIAEKIS